MALWDIVVNLEEKRKKLIHELNNLAQRVELEGNDPDFFTCPEVEWVFGDYTSKAYHARKDYFTVIIKVSENLGEEFDDDILVTNCPDANLSIRREAVKRFTEMVKNKELDNYLE